MRIAIALLLGGWPLGCTAIFGIDAPTRAPDAAVPDAMLDAPTTCPADYTLTLLVSTTRYRIVTMQAPFATQHAACNADQPGRTHLVSLDSIAELTSVRSVVTAFSYVGAVQMPNQTTLLAGWLTFGGAPLPMGWAVGAPDDGDGVENGAQNVAVIDVSGLGDRGPMESFGAVCECDGLPIDATVLSYLP